MGLDPNDLRDVGYIGVGLNGTFLIIVAWRTYVTFQDEPNKITTSVRPVFHISLVSFAVLEFLYMIGLSVAGDYTKWNYSCHQIALWFNLVAFSTVIILWARTIALGGSSVLVNRFVLLVNLVNLILTLAVFISLLAADNMNSYLDSDPVPYLLSIFVHSISLMAFSIWMLSYGMRLQWKLTTYPQWEPMEVTRRVEILFKINIVLVLCVVCYSLRVIALAFLLVDTLADTSFTDVTSTLGWFAVSEFIPTLIPGVVLLYVMRTRKEQPSVQFTQLGAALVPEAAAAEMRGERGEEFLPGFGEGRDQTSVDSGLERVDSDDHYMRYDRYSSVTAPSLFQ